MSLESGFSFVEGPLHSKAMFEGGDPRLNARPPCLSTPEPALLLADRALSTQRASSRQNDLLNSQFCSQSLIVRARITAISRRQPRGLAKEGNMVLERLWPLSLAGQPGCPQPLPTLTMPFSTSRCAPSVQTRWVYEACLCGSRRCGVRTGSKPSLDNGSGLRRPKVFPPIWWTGKAQISEKELQTCLQPIAPMTRTSVRKRSSFA